MKKPMKNKLIVVVLAAIAMVVVAQDFPNLEHFDEYRVIRSPDLNAAKVRVYATMFSLDRRLSFTIELVRTNGVVLDRSIHVMSRNDCRTWFETNAPKQFLKGWVLERATLAEAP